MESLGYALEEYEFVFVDFFANWCSHCRALAPTWERFAEIMHNVEGRHDTAEKLEGLTEEELAKAMQVKHPVLVAKVDCVTEVELCRQESIMAYPTLILFVNGGRALVRLTIRSHVQFFT
jgi:thiol-disulfide isomerase/thioredoxin